MERIFHLAVASMLMVHAHSSAVVLRQSLSSWRDLVYAAPITMGTPPQNFRLTVADLMTGPTVAEQCCVACCHMHWYDPHKSTTYHVQPPFGGRTQCILDNDDSCGRCFGFQESLQIVGDSTLSMRYNHSATVQEATAETTFARQPFDGYLGLDTLDEQPKMGIVNTAYALGLLKSPVYTVNFQRTCADGIDENAGVITYGEADTSNCDAKINYVEPDGTKFTELRLGNLKLTPRNGVKYWSLVSSSYTEPNILVASEDFDPFDEHPKPQPLVQILAELNAIKEDATGLYTVDCSSVPTFTDLTLVINGETYKIPSSEYAYKSSANGKCYVRFGYRRNQGTTNWVLGLPFLHRYCQVVDYTRQDGIGWSRNLQSAPLMCTYSANDAEARSDSVCQPPKDPVKCTDMDTKPATVPNTSTMPHKDAAKTTASTTDASTTKARDATDPHAVAGTETVKPRKNPGGVTKPPTDSSTRTSGGLWLWPAKSLLCLLSLMAFAL